MGNPSLQENDLKKLTLKQFEMATDFVNDHARPIDRAMFRYHFENASVEFVFEAT